MKRVIACLVALLLLCLAGTKTARADMIPGPRVPERRTAWRIETTSVYSVAAGVVAVALAGSLVALRMIRRRSAK
ncbi:MAG: hypothetical protein ABFC96_08215 [Thermoguttaceae bacterium]